MPFLEILSRLAEQGWDLLCSSEPTAHTSNSPRCVRAVGLPARREFLLSLLELEALLSRGLEALPADRKPAFYKSLRLAADPRTVLEETTNAEMMEAATLAPVAPLASAVGSTVLPGSAGRSRSSSRDCSEEPQRVEEALDSAGSPRATADAGCTNDGETSADSDGAGPCDVDDEGVIPAGLVQFATQVQRSGAPTDRSAMTSSFALVGADGSPGGGEHLASGPLSHLGFHHGQVIPMETGGYVRFEQHLDPGAAGAYMRFVAHCPLGACGSHGNCRKTRSFPKLNPNGRCGPYEPLGFCAVWLAAARRFQTREGHMRFHPQQREVLQYLQANGYCTGNPPVTPV